MKIDRSKLLQKLYLFSQEGNGVIIGKPGIGKSYALSQLSDLLWDQKTPSYIINVDQTEGSDQAFSSELGVKGDWVDALNNLKNLSQHKAILIIDAFDAARDEVIRKAYLSLIRKAIAGLSQEKWNVLVSVRTYDAAKSPQLLRLFPLDPTNSHSVTCRSIEITELDEQELASALNENKGLYYAHSQVTNELRTVLKIPFFLRLLEIVIDNSRAEDIQHLTALKSETELLNAFWAKKILQTETSYQKESFLKELSTTLVTNKSLYFSKDKFTTKPNLSTFKLLRSDDIISETGINERDIAFSHNIFFDYAVGRLIIPERPQELITFVLEDKSRPFFLRPSFIFHFTALWHNRREEYWNVFDELLKSNDPNIRLFQRFLMISVVANEFSNVGDVSKIINDQQPTQWFLQSIRFLNSDLNKKHLDLLDTLSKKLDLFFLWDFAVVFKNLLDKTATEPQNQTSDRKVHGDISRTFLEYILKKRDNVENRFALDRLGASRGIEFVSKTYDSNREGSKKLLEKILDMMKEPKFDIWYISCLSDNIKHFAPNDPNFAATVYFKIFGHTEYSDEKTSMGGTVTLNLTSNRRQDFNMCYYRLLEYFPIFLKTAPKIAIETGLKIAVNYILHEKVKFRGKGSLPNTVVVKGIAGRYVPDLSSMWHDMLVYHKPAEFVDKIISYFEELIKQGSVQVFYDQLHTYIENAEVAFAWKRLIMLGNKYPTILKDYLASMAENRQILEGFDTVHEIGISLEKISAELDPKQLLKIEAAILQLSDVTEEELLEASERTINRLLNCIPKELLTNKRSLAIIGKNERVANDPMFQTNVSVTPFTTERWLEEEGVNMKEKPNKDVYELIERLQVFNHKWLNNKPQRDHFTPLMKDAEDLFAKIQPPGLYNEGLRFSALIETAKFCAIICRAFRELSEGEYIFCKDVLLFALKYDSKYDDVDENRSAASGYSSTPRIEAAGGLVDLFRFNADEQIFAQIQTWVKNSNPIVRFNIAKNISPIWLEKPDEFWDMVLERFKNENDAFTLGTLIYGIYRSDIIEKSGESISVAIKLLESQIEGQGAHDTFMKAYVLLLLYLLQKHNSRISEDIISSNLSKSEFATSVSSKIFELADPKFPANDYSKETTNEILIKLLKSIVNSTLTELKGYNTKDLQTNASAGEKLKVLDFIIQRIYFALDINERIANRHELHPTEENKRFFFNHIESIYQDLINNSKEIGAGLILGHTTHYMIETLNGVLDFYPEKAEMLLDLVTKATKLSRITGYTFDSTAIEEVVSFTEKIIADHKNLLRKDSSLNNLTELLNMYVESGWTEALNLLWRLDEAFK